MTTVINTPPAREDFDSGVGMVLGVILGLVLIALFFIYILPVLRSEGEQKNDDININVTLPLDKTTPTPAP